MMLDKCGSHVDTRRDARTGPVLVVTYDPTGFGYPLDALVFGVFLFCEYVSVS
jgi:hypothetical protein